MNVRLFQTLAQAGTLIVALVGLAFAPPARGRMLLVPLSRSAASGLAAQAVGGGALLLGKGPLTGSLVVEADRERLDAASSLPDVIILSAPAVLCGGQGTGVRA